MEGEARQIGALCISERVAMKQMLLQLLIPGMSALVSPTLYYSS